MSLVKKMLLFSCCMSFIMGSSVCFGAKLPEPEQCTSCHGVGVVYEEWASGRSHAEVYNDEDDDRFEHGCFECHIPGKMQQEKDFLAEGEKEGFHILGYKTAEGFVRVEGNEVCVRCHQDAHHAGSGSGAGKIKCIECHMPEDGLTTYRVHNYYPPGSDAVDLKLNLNLEKPESITLRSVRKYVTRPHRVHSWSIPSE